MHLDHVPSHRGILQPAAEIAALCRAAGVPLVLDAAQSLGHVDTDLGADVVYGTSRKWLAGPRGVGVLIARPAIAAQLTPALAPQPEDAPPMRAFESGEGHVAGPDRARSWRSASTSPPAPTGCAPASPASAGPPARLLDGVAGWTVVEPADEPTATTTLRPPDGVDVVATRARLLTEHGIVLDRASARSGRPAR